ncbi:hypothetical protein Tco_0918228 [Tanacetum coccineum]
MNRPPPLLSLGTPEVSLSNRRLQTSSLNSSNQRWIDLQSALFSCCIHDTLRLSGKLLGLEDFVGSSEKFFNTPGVSSLESRKSVQVYLE